MFETLQDVRDYLSGDRINCLVCHKWFKRLAGKHLQLHSMNADDYRAEFGIPWTYPLTSAASRETSRKSMPPQNVVTLINAPRGNKGNPRKAPPVVGKYWREHIRPMGPEASARVHVTLPCDYCQAPVLTTLLTRTHGVRCKTCAQVHIQEYRLKMAGKKAA